MSLKEWQLTPNTDEQIATIPTLTIEDVNPKTVEYPIEVVDDAFGSGVTMIKNEVSSSSGIVYVDFGLDVSTVEFSDLHYLSLLEEMLTRTGAGNITYDELTEQIMEKTGGVWTLLFIEPVSKSVGNKTMVKSDRNFITKLFIYGKSLAEKSSELLEIIEMIMTKANLDSQSKALEILKERCFSTEMGVSSYGHSYSSYKLFARYTVSGVIEEKMHGVSSINPCYDLLKEVEDN